MRILFKTIVSIILTFALIADVLLAAPEITRVYAETVEAIQTQVGEIISKIEAARTGLGFSSERFPNDDILSTFRFSRTLLFGARGKDVRYLQILLNRDSATRVNAPGLIGGAGAETNYFGLATKAAVVKFQEKYAAEILLPAGFPRGTGIAGPLTRNKLNALFLAPPLEAQETYAALATPISPRAPELSTVNASTTAPAPEFSFEEVNRKTRAALVNIICTSVRGGSFNLVSGSGVIVDPRGIILTNAHLGQYFLLQDYPTPGSIECVIRTGEPARNKYRASLLFIPPSWVRDNASKITADEPTGTGENDFALLLIQSTIAANTPLPELFPYVPMDFSDNSLRKPAEVLIAAYPVGFLSGITIQKDLYPSSSIVMTGTVYSFEEKTPDVFSLGGSVVAQQGSSGGAVVSKENTLIGLIVTSSTGKTTGERDLNALTLSHIDSGLRATTGDGIRFLLAEDVHESAKDFNERVAPNLRKIFEDELTKE